MQFDFQVSVNVRANNEIKKKADAEKNYCFPDSYLLLKKMRSGSWAEGNLLCEKWAFPVF